MTQSLPAWFSSAQGRRCCQGCRQDGPACLLACTGSCQRLAPHAVTPGVCLACVVQPCRSGAWELPRLPSRWACPSRSHSADQVHRRWQDCRQAGPACLLAWRARKPVPPHASNLESGLACVVQSRCMGATESAARLGLPARLESCQPLVSVPEHRFWIGGWPVWSSGTSATGLLRLLSGWACVLGC